MKAYTLLATAALIASPAVMANDMNLCELNLQEIDQNMATNQITLGEPAETEVKNYIKQAKEAQSSGNVEECIAHSSKALQTLKGPGSSTSPGSAGSSSGSGN